MLQKNNGTSWWLLHGAFIILLIQLCIFIAPATMYIKRFRSPTINVYHKKRCSLGRSYENCDNLFLVRVNWRRINNGICSNIGGCRGAWLELGGILCRYVRISISLCRFEGHEVRFYIVCPVACVQDQSKTRLFFII